ncbi:phosphatase PAP2 family protein [Magnetospira sp. QH-2]|uniref:phosphatase PAP2 family protein n=1 Tax=Magnetospira sp. (strain QH-2) TaxID=1288970 RepID=UPI0003E81663|nr:phosphatase PAP2 family protein [Magnetospira sp. QH-2]CCQ75053.1 putative phosphatase [Magnetospira sp. QH-2]
MSTLTKIIALLLILSAALAELFHLFPTIDLWIARHLFETERGYFPWQNTPLGEFIDTDLRKILAGVMILFVLDAVRSWLGKRTLLGFSKRGYLFILLSIVLSAGLLANVLLKDHSGRARPKDLSEFGGKAIYTAPLTLADQCRKNCSTVAGDAAFAFNALALALLARRRRPLWIAVATGVGLAAATARVMQGKHFFTDATFASLFTVLVVLVLYAWMINGREPEPNDASPPPP